MQRRPHVFVFMAAAVLAALSFGEGHAMANDRTVTVSGQGEVSVAPDIAIVKLGVEARGSDQKATQREVEQVVRDFIAACGDFDVPKGAIKTAQLNIRPEYDWSKGNSRQLIGYYVHRSLEVRLTDISKLGLLMEQATSLGVNQAQSPQLQSSRKDELLREALALAATNARLNAETVATTLDAKVGKVRNISTTNVSFRPPPQPRMMAAMESRAAGGKSGADTFEAGEIKYSADVNVEFDLVVD
ncbi:MAG: SIMPL domain-containing protein [Pseudomonadota bacterium]